MIKRIAALAAGAVLTAGLALTATTAHAGVTGSTGTTDGMAGYTGTTLGVAYRSMIATWDLTPIARNIGTTTDLTRPQGALGEQLCSDGTGKAAELGTVYNGGGTFSVAFALGQLPVNNADPCRNNGILHNGGKLHPLLSGLAVGDSVTGLIIEERHGVLFAAEDLATGQSFETWQSCGGRWLGHHHGWHWNGCPRYNEPGAGVIQNLTLLGGAATGDLVDFTGVAVSPLTTAVPAVNLGTLNDIRVDSSGTGFAPWLVGPASTPGLGPNAGIELCPASLTTALQVPVLTAGGPQYGPLLPGGDRFSVCVAPAVGA